MYLNSLLLLVICIALLHYSSGQIEYGLCSQVFQMHQYCTKQKQHPPDNSNSTPIYGARGKAGPRGLPGKSAVVDYVSINATILEFCESHSDILNNRLDDMEEVQARNRNDILQLQRDLQKALIQHQIDLTGWYKASNGLYYKVFQTKTDYVTAKSKCVEEAGVLATVGPRDPTVRNEIINIGKNDTKYIWIGLDDRDREGRFVWLDGVAATSSNTDWYSGQPDDARGAEDCVHFHVDYSWKMNDAPCTILMKFVCEKKA